MKRFSIKHSKTLVFSVAAPLRGAVLLAIGYWLLAIGAQSAIAAARQPAVSAADASTEPQCIQILQSAASLTEKDAACARLKFIGTTQCIPALAALLTDEQLSHSARYALEGMSSPEAGRALREALGKTTGLTKVGIIDSLGCRGETEAVSALAEALGDSEAAIGAAAAAALGQIAGPEALYGLAGRQQPG